METVASATQLILSMILKSLLTLTKPVWLLPVPSAVDMAPLASRSMTSELMIA